MGRLFLGNRLSASTKLLYTCHEDTTFFFRRASWHVSQTPVVEREEIEFQLQDLLLAVHEETGMPVVVLVDEYDKAIIDHLGKGQESLAIAKANRDILIAEYALYQSIAARKFGIVSTD
ncbi:MAG: AAA family ATPase [bacterium]|nr:AAA family ATPase [bacterium]